MASLDGICLGPADADPFGPNTRKRDQRSALIQSEPLRRLLRLGVGIFAERRKWHEATALGGQPSTPVRRIGVADIRRDAWKLWRGRHAPAHHGQFPLSFLWPNHRGHLIGKNRRKWRQVARSVPSDLKQVADRLLVS